LERIAGGRITVEKYIEEIEISWDMYKFHPHVYFEGWTTWVSLYEPRTGSTAVKIAGVSVRIFARAKFMATSMTHDTTANVSGLTPDMWPVMSFITADGGLYGIILRIMGDNVFERLGCFLASMGPSWAWGVRGDGEAVAYRDTDYGYLSVIAAVQRGVKVHQLAKLECERPTIKLVWLITNFTFHTRRWEEHDASARSNVQGKILNGGVAKWSGRAAVNWEDRIIRVSHIGKIFLEKLFGLSSDSL
jgi:hypothetical protein